LAIEDGSLRLPEAEAPVARAAPIERTAPSWRREWRARLVKFGIQAIWGTASTIPPSAAGDVPLLQAGARLFWLRILGTGGVRTITSTSALGYPFVCHIGDLAEYPFYDRRACRHELLICAAWLDGVAAPVIYDAGANVGFFATQLTQMLPSAQIHAFEPVPTTFARLVESVRRLGLHGRIHPVAAAVVDQARSVRMSYSQRNSLFAQITPHGLNPRVGDDLVEVEAITLDDFSARSATVPALVKIDVEGSEVAVLRGANRLLAGAHKPALLFEHNPITLAECQADLAAFQQLLAGYTLFYVDDYEGQKRPFSSPVAALAELGWVCNVFAVPLTAGSSERWQAAVRRALSRL
jgi:FkbM family methyltransferase